MVILMFSNLATKERHQSKRGFALLGGNNYYRMLVI